MPIASNIIKFGKTSCPKRAYKKASFKESNDRQKGKVTHKVFSSDSKVDGD